MLISYDPTITGGFVYHIMADKEVKARLDNLQLTEQDKHNLVKEILIAGTRDLNIDVNKKIIRAKLTTQGQ